jgi:hypothetical protein
MNSCNDRVIAERMIRRRGMCVAASTAHLHIDYTAAVFVHLCKCRRHLLPRHVIATLLRRRGSDTQQVGFWDQRLRR